MEGYEENQLGEKSMTWQNPEPQPLQRCGGTPL
jgi:hypothetical protein